MAIVTDITKLSQTASLNGPDGAVDPPNVLDDQDRYLGSFIAMLRDGVGFTAGALVTSLGFTPVRQGTGPGQANNPVSIGWNATLGRLLVSVDANPFANSWPIEAQCAFQLRSGGTIGGSLITLTWTDPGSGGAYAWCGDGPSSAFVRPISSFSVNYANTANTANNANAVNGISGWSYSNAGNNPAYLWATEGSGGAQHLTTPGALSVNYANTANYANSAGSVDRSNNSNNADNFQGRSNDYWLNNGNTAVRNVRNNGTAQLLAGLSGFGDTWWSTNPSDARLKKDVRPTQADSLSQIMQLRFVGYRFRDDVTDMPVDDGGIHPVGVIAQDAEIIEPRWISNVGTWKQPDLHAMLMSTMHAVQQLTEKVARLESST